MSKDEAAPVLTLPAISWREYHELTKHSAQSLRRTQHTLDWANMPDPFRHYEGVPVLDLPADPPASDISALEVLQGVSGTTPAPDGSTFLSQLLFYSAAISASKRVPSTGYRYALRVNPSSGNLHPTEFHFLTRGLKEWPDGLYHYRPSSHMAEQRAVGQFESEFPGAAPITFVLTSIAWREAWKYRDRAYRYCLHDMGHAWQAIGLAARAMGCDSFAVGGFPDDEMAASLRLNDDEWPMLIVKLQGAAIPLRETDDNRDAGEVRWFGGEANRLSVEQVPYALIERFHAATKLDADEFRSLDANATQAVLPLLDGTHKAFSDLMVGPTALSIRSFGEVTRTRRSALDFKGGDRTMSLAELSAILAVGLQPFDSDFGDLNFVQLYLYVHRVDGLPAGVYRYRPAGGELESVKSGDQRVAAAGLSLGQDLAGNACVTFSMIADLDRATRAHGDRGYRYVHFEAGAIGHRMYLAAEALGMGATGIGAFFDDEVHRYLNVGRERGQVVYHFAIGYPVVDPRMED